MEIFNVGLGEMLMIIIIALLVFGPERLPEVVRRIAHFINDIRRVASDVQQTFMEETRDIRMPLEELRQDITSLKTPLDEVAREGTALRNELATNVQAINSDIKQGAVATPAPVVNGATPNGSSAPRPYKPLSSSEVSDDNA